MQKFTQKYVIVALINKISEGTEYPSSKWPLHITIASPFAVDLYGTNIIEKLSKLLINEKPITVITSNDEYFGIQKETLVTLIEPNEKLIALHNKIIKLLKSAGTVFNDPEHIEKGFRAHVTVQPNARLNRGDKIIIDNLALIDMFPNNDPYQRKVLKIIKLSDK